MIRFGPLSDAQDMALIGLYEGEEPANDEVGAQVDLAATLLVMCEPPDMQLDDETGTFLFVGPDATLADWRRAGILEQLHASGVPYEAADGDEQEGWDPLEASPRPHARLLTVRCGPLPAGFDTALALVWAATQERDSSISADVAPSARRLAVAILKETPLGDIRFEDDIITFALASSVLGDWSDHPIGALLRTHRVPHEVMSPAAAGAGINTTLVWDPERGPSTTRTLADGRRCMSRLDYEDLLLHTPPSGMLTAMGRLLRPHPLFRSASTTGALRAQQHQQDQTHERRESEDARPQRPEGDERAEPGLVDDDKANEPGNGDKADAAHHSDVIAR